MPETEITPHRWFAVRCVSGREVRVVEAVLKLATDKGVDLDAYTPVVTRWRRIRFSRKATVREKFELALFPGIVFVFAVAIEGEDLRFHIDGGQREAIKDIDDVRGFYEIRDATGEGRPAALPARAIDQIRLRQFQGEFDETRPKEPDYKPAVKDRAFIEDGDWVSKVGEILKIKASQGTATLMIDGRRVKAGLKKLRPEPKEEEIAA